MKVSVILPVYNVESWLQECLESIGSQDYDDMECIVVDDRGTDRSMEICRNFIEGYRGHVEWRVVTLPVNSGVSVARNAGTEAAGGEYVLYVDSDDVLGAGAVSRLVAETVKHPGIDVVQGAADCTDATNYHSVVLLHSLNHLAEVGYCDRPGEMFRLFVEFLFPGSPWNKLVRRSMLVEHGIKSHPELRAQQDWLWVYELSHAAKDFALVHDVTYHYRSDAVSSTTNTISHAKRAVYWKMILERVIADGVPRYHRHEAAYRCLDIFMSNCRHGNADYGNLSRSMGLWLNGCGLPMEGCLLTMSHTAAWKPLRKVCNTVLWRLAHRRFPRPWQ